MDESKPSDLNQFVLKWHWIKDERYNCVNDKKIAKQIFSWWMYYLWLIEKAKKDPDKEEIRQLKVENEMKVAPITIEIRKILNRNASKAKRYYKN